MIPVEEGKTSAGRIPSSSATCWQTCLHALRPCFPVAQFAFPELTMTARIRPLTFDKCALPTSTGAATTRFLVNSAAAVDPGAASTSARSRRPLALMPAARAEKLKPLGK